MICLLRVVATILVLAGSLSAQAPAPIVLSGTPITGSGRVTGIRAVNIDYFGQWIVLTSTDDPHSPAAVFRGDPTSAGGVWKKVGDPVFFPTGATVASFDSITAELFGGFIWNTRLTGTAGGEDDEALYYENMLWIQEGPLAPYQGTNLPAGTRWLGFDEVDASSADGTIMLRGRIDDPGIGGPSETLLARGFIAGAPGLLFTMDRLVSEGQLVPGFGERVQSVRLEPAAAALSPNGAGILWGCDLRGDPSTDGCVLRYVHASGLHTLVAREGSASPVAGRTWGPLEDIAVDLNSFGAWTLRAHLDDSDPTTDAVIVHNGQVLAREGDSPPAVAPAVIVGFGRATPLVGEDGRVVWYAHLSGPGGPSEALFVDNQLLLQTGVTQIAGRTLRRLSALPEALSISPAEDQLVFTGTLHGGLVGAFLMGY